MANKTEFVINKRSITAGGKTRLPGTVVTAESLKITDEQFKDLCARKDRKDNPLIIKRNVNAAAPAPPAGGGGGGGKIMTAQDRYEKIRDAIKTLYGEDGKPLNMEDFTQAEEPKVEALEELLKEEPGFSDGINVAERNAALTLYKESLNGPSE